MFIRWLIAGLLLPGLLPGLLASGQVESLRETWHDAERQRDVPVTIHYLAASEGAAPVIIMSHGLGGTRDGYGYLGKAWAEAGYISVHVQHLGSDDTVWRDQPNPLQAMRQAARNWRLAVDRPLDVSYVLTHLEHLNAQAEHPLHGRLNLAQVGVAGHSFGSHTALAVGGLRFQAPGRGQSFSFRDERVDAIIAMSSPVARGDQEAQAAVYADIGIPVLHMTGTADTSLITDTTAQERRVPYDLSIHAERYLLTLADGDHLVFSGREQRRPRLEARDAPHQALIVEASVAFWNAYLRQDAEATRWLTDGGMHERTGELGLFEHAKAAAQHGTP